jgi:hypothetical protein
VDDDDIIVPPPPPRRATGGKGLDRQDRERLSEVLRELLECKRLLERARDI